MKTANITLGKDVIIDPSTAINNVNIGDNVKIAKNCSIFGAENNILQIGEESFVGMGTLLNGFREQLTSEKMFHSPRILIS